MPPLHYAQLELPPPPADRPYVLVNMVMSVDGKAVVEGSEAGIGSKTDQRLMRELRTNADVILNGAGTLRATGSSPRLGDPALEELRLEAGKTRLPISAVLSRSGDLPLDRIFFTATDFEAVVYLGPDAPADARAAIRATGRKVVDLPPTGEITFLLYHMRHELGASVLLVEGGPDTNSQLFALDAIDEYFTTIGPVIVGGEHTLTPVEGPTPFSRDQLRRLSLLSAHTNPESGELYLRYKVRH
jgi:riboflavin biosynthesis pyrimidine reductase